MSDEHNRLSQLSVSDPTNSTNSGMSRNEFLLEMDEILDLPAGTLRGHEKLEELENWDSTSLITFIAMAESYGGVSISAAQIVTCSTVADLLRLARMDASAF